MKKMLYANGDSFTYGMEILGNNDRSQQNKNHAYPVVIAENLGIQQVLNGSFIGAPNEFIFRQTMFELIELERTGVNPNDVLVVIGWTVPFRSEINLRAAVHDAIEAKVLASADAKKNLEDYPEFNKWGNLFISAFAGTKYQFNNDLAIDLSAAKEFHVNYMWDWDLEYNKWFSQVIALEHFLKSRGYDFVFFNAVHPFSLDADKLDNKAKEYMHLLSGDNYYKFLDWGWSDWGQTEYPQHVTEYQHFNEEMHKMFGNELAEYIRQTILKDE